MNGIPVAENSVMFYTVIALLYIIVLLKVRENSAPAW